MALLTIIGVMVFGFLAFSRGGSLHWMGVFWLLQGATWWLVVGATPKAHAAELIASRFYRAISSLLLTRLRVFQALVATWITLFFLYYYVCEYSRLEFGAVGLLSSGFLLSTYVLYAGRQVVTKSDIKALDYVTIVSFAAVLVSILDIDTQTYQIRSDTAKSQADALEPVLQAQIDSLLSSCPRPDHPVSPGDAWSQYYDNWLPSFLHITEHISPSDLLCNLWSSLRATKLKDLSEDTLYNLQHFSDLSKTLVPQEANVQNAIDRLLEYSSIKTEIELHKGKPPNFIAKNVAYLLGAFAFAVRLARTTIEVFEWHDVPAETDQIPTDDQKPGPPKPPPPSPRPPGRKGAAARRVRRP